MIPTVSRNGRFAVLVGLICLLTLWSYRPPHFCLFQQCRNPPSPQQNIKNNGDATDPGLRWSPVLGLGGSSSNVQYPRPPPHTNNNGNTDLSKPDAPFVAWPLARVCTETTKWTPGLVFVCDNNSGGIGNIRNFILTCLRYAIEAGATGITLPDIQTRSKDKLADLFRGRKVSFSHFFDEGHFRESLGDACPRIVIYDHVEDVVDVTAAAAADDGERSHEEGELSATKRPAMITPKQFGMRGGCDSRDLNRHSDLFGARFHAWLAERQESRPTKLIRFNWGVQWDWPVHRDGPEFTATFGGLLRFRPDILELGEKVVAAMERYTSSLGSKKGPAAAPPPPSAGGFLGVHLRTENDALSNWPSFDEQVEAYLARASTLEPPPRLAYLATGNATEAARFAALAAAAQGTTGSLRVVTKHQLLSDEGEEELERLSWDQQALVDFVVLLHAEFFVGVSPSSFSMNVALKRHLRGEGIYTRPWRVGSEEGDGRSWLVGRYESYWEDWLFMYDSLWP